MALTTTYCRLPEDQPVPQAWFDTTLQKFLGKDETHRSILTEEMIALQAFCFNKTTPEEAAHAITRPISKTSIPKLGTGSDEIVALVKLLDVLVLALIEWPSSCTQDLIALLSAISNTPDHLHRGEATDEDGEPFNWKGLPYFTMPWHDNHWMDPIDIIEELSDKDEAEKQRVRDNYLKTQDVEAQLVAAGIFDIKRAYNYLIWTLEWKLDPAKDDRLKAEKSEMEERAQEPLVPDYHIPAVARWIKHCGKKVYESLSNDEMKGWNKRDMPSVTKHFEQPVDRWKFWKQRLNEVAKDGPDEFTRDAAELAVRYMQDTA